MLLKQKSLNWFGKLKGTCGVLWGEEEFGTASAIWSWHLASTRRAAWPRCSCQMDIGIVWGQEWGQRETAPEYWIFSPRACQCLWENIWHWIGQQLGGDCHQGQAILEGFGHLLFLIGNGQLARGHGTGPTVTLSWRASGGCCLWWPCPRFPASKSSSTKSTAWRDHCWLCQLLHLPEGLQWQVILLSCWILRKLSKTNQKYLLRISHFVSGKQHETSGYLSTLTARALSLANILGATTRNGSFQEAGLGAFFDDHVTKMIGELWI